MNQLPRSIDEHMKYIQQKGMAFPEMEAAADLFSRVSCSRPKYYWRNLIEEDSNDDFKDGTPLSTIIERYVFDHNFRVILFDAIETIEFALRAKIIDYMLKASCSGLWYLDLILFEDIQRHQDFVLDGKYEFGRSLWR